MEALAESPRDFFVQMTRALVLMRKGDDKETQKKTRTALELAWMSRPVVSVGAMVLDLDYRLLDRESAERHALQILRLDAGHAFANWVMGSIRMGQGNMKDAETYLRTSVAAPHPLAAAQNDLAELLRQDKRLVEAEKYARDAKNTDPKLYVVWETLCATLLDQNKNLDEAEQCIKRAIELEGDKDVRMQVTLARVQIAKKDFTKARGTLRALGRRRDELTDRDRTMVEELQKQVQGK
jgi:Flp pilus assembly protein TadD